MSRLFRRREVWLPTAWGWLALLALVACGLGTLALGVPRLLAPESPARGPDGRGARTLVVEGWLSEAELNQAVDAIGRGRYERVVTSGGPIEPEIDMGGWHDYASRAAALLRAKLTNRIPVIAVPAPATRRDRTYLSALRVRDWARGAGVPLDAVDVYSAGVHARRSRLLYRMALGEAAEVGVLSAHPHDFELTHWWRSSVGAKAVMGEAISLGWTVCCFWPHAPG